MARHFTGASGDYIDFAAGSVSGVDGGPSTVAVLWRPTSVHEGWLINADNGAATTWAVNPYSDSHLWHSMSGFRQTMAYSALDGWRLDIWTKPSGSAQVRGHSMLLSAGTWSHADYGASADSASIPITRIRVGKSYYGSGALNGDVAAMAVVGAEWSDAAIEAAGLETGVGPWMTLIGVSSAAVWLFDQASVSTSVPDFTGGGADQTARSGTSISTDPPGFSYSIAPPVSGALAGTLPAVTGSLAGLVYSPTVSAGLVMGLYAGSVISGGSWSNNPALTLTLHTSGYVPDRVNHASVADLSHELASGGGYTAGGVTLANSATVIQSGSAWSTVWAAYTPWSESQVVRPVVANGYVYRCTRSGVSSGVEPAWPAVVGQCVDDGTTAWVCTGSIVVQLVADDLLPAWPAFTAGPFRHVVLSDRRLSGAANQVLVGVFTLPNDQIGTNTDFNVIFGASGVCVITIP